MKRFFLLNFTIFLSFFFSQTTFAEMFLFVDDQCTHCQELDAYLSQNEYYEKFQIQTFEVRNNPANEAFYIQKAQELGYKDLLLPWLVHDKTSYDGKTDIANYLDSLNAQVAETETEDLSADYLSEDDTELLSSLIEAEDEQQVYSTETQDEGTLPGFYKKGGIALGGLMIIFVLIYLIRRRVRTS